MVLAVFARRATVGLQGLLRAEMYATQASCAVVPNQGFAVLENDVLLRTNANAGVATDAPLAIDFRPEHPDHAFFQLRLPHYPCEQTPTTVVKDMFLCLQFADDQVHAGGDAVQFLQLVVGVSSKSQSAVVRHAHFVTIGQFHAFLAQHPTQRPNAVAGLTAAGDDGKHICFGTQFQSADKHTHGWRQVEVVGREDQTNTFFLREVLCCGIVE